MTKDIPSNVVAVGNPCRVMREVGGHDRKYYFKDKEIDQEEWKVFFIMLANLRAGNQKM